MPLGELHSRMPIAPVDGFRSHGPDALVIDDQ
jgi:hypothetical protein